MAKQRFSRCDLTNNVRSGERSEGTIGTVCSVSAAGDFADPVAAIGVASWRVRSPKTACVARKQVAVSYFSLFAVTTIKRRRQARFAGRVRQTVGAGSDTPKDQIHDRSPPLPGAFRLARWNRSLGAAQAPRIPRIPPTLARKRARVVRQSLARLSE